MTPCCLSLYNNNKMQGGGEKSTSGGDGSVGVGPSYKKTDKSSIPCRKGEACTDARCAFQHPLRSSAAPHPGDGGGAGKAAAAAPLQFKKADKSAIPCRKGMSCTDAKCAFQHPSPAAEAAALPGQPAPRREALSEFFGFGHLLTPEQRQLWGLDPPAPRVLDKLVEAERQPAAALAFAGPLAQWLAAHARTGRASAPALGEAAAVGALLEAAAQELRSSATVVQKDLCARLDTVVRLCCGGGSGGGAPLPGLFNASRWVRGTLARQRPLLLTQEGRETIASALSAMVRSRLLVQPALAAAHMQAGSSSPQPCLRLSAGSRVVILEHSATDSAGSAVEACLLRAHSACTGSAAAVPLGEGAALPTLAAPASATVSVVCIQCSPAYSSSSSSASSSSSGTSMSLWRRLAAAGLPTTLAPFSSLASALLGATHVLLGCVGVLGDGCALVQAGSTALARQARARSVPLACVAESFKFTERIIPSGDASLVNLLATPGAEWVRGGGGGGGLQGSRAPAGGSPRRAPYHWVPYGSEPRRDSAHLCARPAEGHGRG
jgi:hypothetical protein